MITVAAPRTPLTKAILRAKYDGRVQASPAAYKDWLRWEREKVQGIHAPRSFAEALDEARMFWALYEQINRDYLPDDPVYSIFRSGAALSTTADHLGGSVSATGQIRILECIIGGEATASAVCRIALQLSGNATGSTAITPEPFNTHSPAAAGSYFHSSTTALAGNPFLVFAFNAFGGFIDYKFPPGGEKYFKDGEDFAWRSLSNTSTCSSTIVFEEL